MVIASLVQGEKRVYFLYEMHTCIRGENEEGHQILKIQTMNFRQHWSCSMMVKCWEMCVQTYKEGVLGNLSVYSLISGQKDPNLGSS